MDPTDRIDPITYNPPYEPVISKYFIGMKYLKSKVENGYKLFQKLPKQKKTMRVLLDLLRLQQSCGLFAGIEAFGVQKSGHHGFFDGNDPSCGITR